MGLKTIATDGTTPLTLDVYRLGANAKNISIRKQGTIADFYTVPTGKIFTGYMQGSYNTYPIIKTAEGQSASIFKDYGTYKGNNALPIVLLAGSALRNPDTSYEYSVFGVESDA